MWVGISTLIKDNDGSRLINQDAEAEAKNNTGARRVSRVPTLDGGASIVDSGYAAADRTYTVKTRANQDIADWAERIIRNYNFINLATQYGFFKGVPSRWYSRDDFIFIEILIKTEIA